MKKLYFLLIALLCSAAMLNAATFIVLSNNDAWGTVTGGGEYNWTTVRLTAKSNEGYYFVGWYQGNTLESTSPIYDIPFYTDDERTCTYTAKFAEHVALTINVETPGGLSDAIFDAGKRPAEVTKLTVTGTLNDDDFTLMRETMTSLVDVDLSGITNTSGVNFNGKSTLQRIVLPENLTEIGSNAFQYCSSLTSIEIPNSVTYIDNNAFQYCSSLSSVYVSDIVAWCNIEFDNYYSNPMAYAENLYLNGELVTNVIIPNEVTEIGDYVFFNCSSLISIEIPSSVTSIGYSAFSGCSSLLSIEIPSGVTSIGSSAFNGCSSLAYIDIPNSIVEIGFETFGNCGNLRKLTLGTGLKNISFMAFGEGNSSTCVDTIVCIGAKPPFVNNGMSMDEQCQFVVVNFSTCVLKVPAVAYKDYALHNVWGKFLKIEKMDITYYNIAATANNSEMGEVAGSKYYLPNETVTLEATAYDGYKFSQWSDGVTENPRTFTATEDVTLTAEFIVRPYEVTLICDEAQGTVSGGGEYEPGTQVTITATAKEGYQFSYWRVWDSMGYSWWEVDGNPYTFEMGSQYYEFEAVFEKAKVEVDGVYYYLNDDNTATVTSPNGDEYSGDVVIPETIKVGDNTYTVTTIGDYAFDDSYITSVNIPTTITYVGHYGFDDCYNLSNVKFNSMTPPEFYDNSLLVYGYCGKRINVPCGATSAYEEAFGTGDCWYFVEGEYVLNAYADREGCYVEIQDNIGCDDNQATFYAYSNYENYTFKQWSDGNTDNPRTVTVTSDTTFYAEFAYSYTIEVYSSNEARGTVTGGGKYFSGDSAVIVATPAEGCVFDYWEVYYWHYYSSDNYGCYEYSHTTQENPFEIEAVYNGYKLVAYFKIAPTLIDGIYYYLDKENYSAVVARSDDYTGDIVLPETVTHNRTIYDVTGIEQNAFSGTSITSLVVPNNIRSSVWFYECSNLKVIKGHADFISDIDGLYDTNIAEVYITGGYVDWLDPEDFVSVEVLDLSATENSELSYYMFKGYEYDEYGYEGFANLRKLILPEGLTMIHDRQFKDLWLLEEIVIPEGVTEIPDGAFYDCHALSKVTLSKNLTSIGNYAFYSCHALENIVIPEGVTEIGNAAFYGCTYLEEIELPSTLKEIGNNAFALCSKVKSMKVKAQTPPALWAKTFYDVDRDIPVYVAELAYDDYVADQCWGEFFNIVAVPEFNEDGTGVENFESVDVVIYSQGGVLYIEGLNSDYRLFDATGKLIYSGCDAQLSLPRGMYLLNVGDKTYKVAM